MSPARLRISSPVASPLISRDSGPGRRWLLFLQGCARPCTDVCLNPALLDSAAGVSVGIDELRMIAEQVAVGTWGPVEGITVLGGEPTDQAEPLTELLEFVVAAGLSVVLYSGRTLGWIRRSVPKLLERVDVVIDGPYIPQLGDPELRWRGSRNQRVRRLTNRYTSDDLARGMSARGITATLGVGSLPILSGLQARGEAASVESALGTSRSSRECPRTGPPPGAAARIERGRMRGDASPGTLTRWGGS